MIRAMKDGRRPKKKVRRTTTRSILIKNQSLKIGVSPEWHVKGGNTTPSTSAREWGKDRCERKGTGAANGGVPRMIPVSSS